MWEKMLFLLGTLRFQFKPFERDSVGICTFWSMKRVNSWVFDFFWKKWDFGWFWRWICCRSQRCCGNSDGRLWRLQQIWGPKCRKSRFFKFSRKRRISATSYFRMGKFRQNLENLVPFEIWARIEIFQISWKWKKAWIWPVHAKCREKNQFFFVPK